MSDAEVERVHASFVGVVRALGLIRPDTTPCGQPLSLTHAHTISELHSDGPLSQQALAARLRLQKSTVSRLVDELGRDGTVERQPNPSDRRSVLIALTPAGRRKAERLRDAQTELFARLLADTAAEDRRMLADLLDQLARAAHALD
jgi:DNA-binding MarR family transcriptional regulator